MTTLPVGLRTLAIVQAGGAGSRMDVLTRERAKPALPFAGTHALVDFPLSSLVASGVTDVWVSVQYQSSTLDTYLAGGRPWDLDRTHGGFRRITPEQGSGPAQDDGFSHGNADGLFRLRDEILAFDPDVLLVLSADHVFSADLRPMVSRHLERGAECTVVTAEVGVREAVHNMVVHADAEGLVSAVDYKPSSTRTGTVAVEIFLYEPAVLVAELERLRVLLHQDATEHGDTGLGDFGEHLLPALVDRGRVYADPLPGYWRDVGRPKAYLQAHRDLLAGRVDVFDHPLRPVLAPSIPDPPAWFDDEARVSGSMVGPGSRVRGTVRRSVLGPRVEVGSGAVVEDSVLLGDVVVEAGATVRTAVVDEGSRVGRGASVGAAPAGTLLTDEAITLVGRDSRVGGGRVVEAGGRLEPGTTV
ncbi:glucose-1-phosphate adenylyltransferase family protein [Ornithinimicrobium cerasi]|uniref:glucose-1-phosphate adenylyltransferase family protein n=1 Tax=Ornithinimicrobium cerasi TaxID=2248773 RepID=UPI001F41E889|nr:sugar phosphate nucleotidyltransferase [Ornithinimicrobium cerasi]